MAANILVELFKKHGRNGVLLAWDIDLTLRDTMCRNTPPEQHASFMELHCRTDGGSVVMTGRSSASVDQTLTGGYAGSFEHHSAIRMTQGGKIISLAAQIDTTQVASEAAQLIGDRIKVVDSPEVVRASTGKTACVYPEVKDYAVALVHSLGHGSVENDRKILQEVAQQVVDRLGIGNSHKVVVGSDAIEIAPKGLSVTSDAHLYLSRAEVERLETNGLSKSTALHNFMSLGSFSDRIPVVIGDSSPDGRAMNEAMKYDGGGIWVKNGKPVPEEFNRAVGGREIEHFRLTWNHVDSAVTHLRQCAPQHFLPNGDLTLYKRAEDSGILVPKTH